MIQPFTLNDIIRPFDLSAEACCVSKRKFMERAHPNMQETPMVTHTLANALAWFIEKRSLTTKPPPPSADVTPPSGQITPHKLLDTQDLKTVDMKLQSEQFSDIRKNQTSCEKP